MVLKILFVVCSVGFIAGSVQKFSQGELGASDIGQFLNSIFFLVALFGYAYKKAVIHRYFAIAIFLWNAVGYLFVTVMFALMVASSSDVSFGSMSLIGVLLGYLFISYLMYVMFRYAFRSPEIWQKVDNKATEKQE